MLSPTDEAMSIGDTSTSAPRDCPVDLGKKHGLKLKLTPFKGFQRPREILLIEGRDPGCRQKLTFNQLKAGRNLEPSPPPENSSMHNSSVKVPAESSASASTEKANKERNVEAGEDEEELARERKRLKTMVIQA